MQLCKMVRPDGAIGVGILDKGRVRLLRLDGAARTLSDVLHAPDPSGLAQSLVGWEEFLRLPERPETGKR